MRHNQFDFGFGKRLFNHGELIMKTLKYTNWSTEIFEGFYESHLYNSDCPLLTDFDEFEGRVGGKEKAVKLLDENGVWEYFPELDSSFYSERDWHSVVVNYINGADQC